jgi:2-polyprenyl-3-methyl-5-hydroxy-6-metoxy-1,4-benzoquinol methylase
MNEKISDWHIRWNTALREQHDILFDDKTKSIKTEFAEYNPCPVCDSEKTTPLFMKDGFRYVRCQNCSMIYMNPRLNQAATYAFYNSDVNAIYNETKFDAVSTATTLDDKINLENLDLIDQYRNGRPGKILEIGCAKGYFLTKAKERGYQVYGVELNEKNYQIARKNVGDSIYNRDLFDIYFENEMFDVIYLRDVIEHIPNPKPFLQELNRIAKPDSLLFVETHNIDGLINRIVREKHTVIFGFEHPNHWSPKSLGRALNRHGFITKRVIHKSLDFTIGDILGYFIEPTFTTIYPWSISEQRKNLLKVFRYPFLVMPVSWLDRTITPMIANTVKCGSVMKVIAQKK